MLHRHVPPPKAAVYYSSLSSTMSTRFYPRFVKGNPQLRIFLPDWKMVMVKPDPPLPDNIVTFRVDPRMTNWDVKNYLERIYKVQVGAINSVIQAGSLLRTREGLAKRDDYRMVFVTLPLGETFKWPDLFPEEKGREKIDEANKALDTIREGRKLDPHTRVPGWIDKFTNN